MLENRLTRVSIVMAWCGLALAFACGLAELAAGPGYRMGWWTYGTGIQVVRWSATTDIAAAVLAIAAIVLASVKGLQRARILGVLALTLSLVVIAPPLYMWRMVDQVPRIHDISTDTENPPRFVAVIPLRKGSPNSTDINAEVLAQQKKGYPDIVPLRLGVPPAEAFQRAERTARMLGWEIVAVAPQELRIEATDSTMLFGFKDDVVIRVAPDGGGSVVDLRSVSRVGRSDLGANATRIRSFVKALAAAR